LSKLNEECGVFGILSGKPCECANYTAAALLSLQHRGQESAGIAASIDNRIFCHKDLGLVTDVFTKAVLNQFSKNNIALGHVRYSTTGSNSVENAQPIVTNHSIVSFALAHNGNLINASALRRQLEQTNGIVFHTTNDSEVISMYIIHEMLKTDSIEQAIKSAMNVLEGAYSLLIMTNDRLIAVRDKIGFRPLCMGKMQDAIVFASETCALDNIGAKFVRDVEPGEIVSVHLDGTITSLKNDACPQKGLCVFEMIYFARQDSVIDGESVYKARIQMGKFLAMQKPVGADLVCGVPDSGLEAAQGYAHHSGIPYGTAFVKNRYIGRSFIAPSQLARENAVSMKLNPLRASVEGKRIVLVDDSIVRGTTSAKIIQTLRKAGATEIHMRISSPPFLFPCYFGTDVDSSENLIAHKKTIDEIRQYIGADSLEFLSLENLQKIKQQENTSFCSGCFSGTYPVDVSGCSLKEQFEGC